MYTLQQNKERDKEQLEGKKITNEIQKNIKAMRKGGNKSSLRN